MVINGKKSESEIMEELDEEKRERERAFVLKELERARKNLEKAEKNWQDSGGYGSRAPINRWSDQERLCMIAMRAVEYQCERCQKRSKRLYEVMKDIERRQKTGVVHLSLEEVRNIIDSLWG
jgi:hypothetical protein